MLFDGKRAQILDSVDVIVSGGGVGGVACAVALAESGRKVAVVERRGTLGWEIGRARRVFLDLARASESSKVVSEMHRRLVEQGAYKKGVIHAPIAELVFDHMLVERRIEPLFHAWPIAVAKDGSALRGLVVGAKEGYGLIEASAIVETDESGRLVDTALRTPIDQNPVRRSFVLSGTDIDAVTTGLERGAFDHLMERDQIKIRPIDYGFIQVDVHMTQPDYAERERAFPGAVRRTIDALRACDAAFAAAGIVYIADDEWGGPTYTLREGTATADHSSLGALLTDVNGSIEDRALSAGDLGFHDGVVLAGPWLPSVIKASNSEEVAVLNRICLGEAAARFVETIHESCSIRN